VPQLERLAEVGLAGLGGHPDRGRELGHTELRDQRGTRAGDRDRGVPEPDRLRDRLRRVQVRPGDRVLEQVGIGRVATRRRSRGVLEDRFRGVEAPGLLSWSWLYSSRTVFESSVESVEFQLEN
jgi:hypothetical protein